MTISISAMKLNTENKVNLPQLIGKSSLSEQKAFTRAAFLCENNLDSLQSNDPSI